MFTSMRGFMISSAAMMLTGCAAVPAVVSLLPVAGVGAGIANGSGENAVSFETVTPLDPDAVRILGKAKRIVFVTKKTGSLENDTIADHYTSELERFDYDITVTHVEPHLSMKKRQEVQRAQCRASKADAVIMAETEMEDSTNPFITSFTMRTTVTYALTNQVLICKTGKMYSYKDKMKINSGLLSSSEHSKLPKEMSIGLAQHFLKMVGRTAI